MAAVFLDRDGVINHKAPEGEYIAKWEDVRFLPDVVVSLSKLYRAGFEIFIATNQRGIALGKVRLEDVDDIHRRMKATVAKHGIVITDIYFCPHDISEHCACRKPKPGMLLQAAKDHRLDLSTSWMIGDALSDIEAGKNAGCRAVWITPHGSPETVDRRADVLAPNLRLAVDEILLSAQRPAEGMRG
jgi:D-glycero-D-manno-heptose 1,7-bisphosphate phosphatase